MYCYFVTFPKMVKTFGTKPFGIFYHMLINLGVLKLFFGILIINLNIVLVRCYLLMIRAIINQTSELKK